MSVPYIAFAEVIFAWRLENSIIALQTFYVTEFFYLSKYLMVISYTLCTVLFKDIVNFVCFFLAVFRKKVSIINIYLGHQYSLLEYFIFIYVKDLVSLKFTTSEW